MPKPPQAIGGPATFRRQLVRYLKSRGHTIRPHYALAVNVLFATPECSLAYALYAKLRGARIVQRLDGAYHAALPGMRLGAYRLKNLRLKLLHNYLADHIVYQSKFAQKMGHELLGQPRGQTSIIYNAAAGLPAVRHLAEAGPARLQLATAASFRRRDQIEPIIDSLVYLNLHYELHILGPHHPRLAKLFQRAGAQSTIILHGPAKHGELKLQLRRADIFLFSDQSACPNVVIEALSWGLPVVAFDRGSVSELIEQGHIGQIVSLPAHDPFRSADPFTEASHRDFARAITRVARNLPRYRAAALQRSREKFAPATMLRRYEEVLQP